MKKLFTLLSLVFVFTFVNAQRKCDLQVTAVDPSGTITSGVAFNMNVKVKNLGPDAVAAGDTLSIFLVVNGNLLSAGGGAYIGKTFYNTTFALNEEKTLSVLTGFALTGPQGSFPICGLSLLRNFSADSVRDLVSTNNLGCNTVNFVWKTGINTPATSENFIDAISVYPNPVIEQTKITYSLNQNSDIRISIKDITGREVQQVISENQASGLYEKELNLSALKAGVYFVEYLVNDKVYTSKLIKN